MRMVQIWGHKIAPEIIGLNERSQDLGWGKLFIKRSVVPSKVTMRVSLLLEKEFSGVSLCFLEGSGVGVWGLACITAALVEYFCVIVFRL